MEGFIESVNEYTVNNIARETMKGLKENAYNCISTGGIPPLGYDIVDKKYVINEHEAEAVRMIFEMVDNGYGYTEIIKRLNALGYKTKHGNSFGKNSLGVSFSLGGFFALGDFFLGTLGMGASFCCSGSSLFSDSGGFVSAGAGILGFSVFSFVIIRYFCEASILLQCTNLPQ